MKGSFVCRCQSCQQTYRADWNIPNGLWEQIRTGHNLLCGACIAERIEIWLTGGDDYAAFAVTPEGRRERAPGSKRATHGRGKRG